MKTKGIFLVVLGGLIGFGGCATKPQQQHLLISKGVFTIDQRTNWYTVALASDEFHAEYLGTEMECDVYDPLTGKQEYESDADFAKCPMPRAGLKVAVYHTKTEFGQYMAFEYTYAQNGRQFVSRYKVEPTIPSDNWEQ